MMKKVFWKMALVIGMVANGWSVNYTWVGPVSPSTGDWQNASSWSVGTGYPFNTAQQADVAFITGNAIITNVPYSAAPDGNANSDTNSGNQYGMIVMGDDAVASVTGVLHWTTAAIGNNRRSVGGLLVRTNDVLTFDVWSGADKDDAYNDEHGRSAYTNVFRLDAGAWLKTKTVTYWIQTSKPALVSLASNANIQCKTFCFRSSGASDVFLVPDAFSSELNNQSSATLDFLTSRSFGGPRIYSAGGVYGALKFSTPGPAMLTMTNTDLYFPAADGGLYGASLTIGTNNTVIAKDFIWDVANNWGDVKLTMGTNSVLQLCGNFGFDTNNNYSYAYGGKKYRSVDTFRFAGTNHWIRSGTRTNTTYVERWHHADFLSGAKYTLRDDVYSDGGDLLYNGTLSSVRDLTRMGIIITNGFSLIGFRERPINGTMVVIQ